MSLVIVGSIAFDTIETPKEIRHDMLGGSASYFSYAASLYTQVNLVGVVGEDFPHALIEAYQSKQIDTRGLQIKEGKTFRWWGKYSENMNHRKTIEVNLNVFEHFDPILPEEYRHTPFLFLGNGSPVLQGKVLEQMASPPLFVAIDTMDLWIQTQRDDLLKVLKRVHAVFLNDEEARLLTEENNLITAGRKILHMGPRVVIIKKGEHGSMMISSDGIFAAPAFPLDHFEDPTGAGDCFAGGFMGYLAQHREVSIQYLKRAILHGTVVASFAVQGFGTKKLEELSREEVDRRLEEFMAMVYVEIGNGSLSSKG